MMTIHPLENGLEIRHRPRPRRIEALVTDLPPFLHHGIIFQTRAVGCWTIISSEAPAALKRRAGPLVHGEPPTTADFNVDAPIDRVPVFTITGSEAPIATR